jgi:hypothetical protein
MGLLETIEAFTAIDAYGYTQTTIPAHAILHSVGDGSGFRGRMPAGEAASFVYLGSLFYARKAELDRTTKPFVLTKGQRRPPIRTSTKVAKR